MAVPPFNLFTGDGTTATFQYGFTLFKDSAVVVKTRAAGAETFTTQVENTNYSHNKSNKTITFFTGFTPADQTLIRIERLTNRDRQVNYQSGSTLTEPNLDNDCDRLTGVTQEIEAGLADALTRNDVRDAWDGEGLPSENAAPAVESDGWVTLGQAQALIAAGQIVSIDEPPVFTFTGNGATTDFELNGLRGLKRAQVTIHIEGAYQSKRSASPVYSILNFGAGGYPTAGDGDDYIRFDEAPENTAVIEAVVFVGEVLGVLPDEFVGDPDQIANDIIGLQHFDLGAGSATRFLVADTTGKAPVMQQIGLTQLVAASQVLDPITKAALVAAIRLNNLAVPDGDINLNAKKFTSVGTPTASDHFATKGYADGLVTLRATGTFLGADLNGFGTAKTLEIGFQPDVFCIMGSRVAYGNTQASWLWTRGSVGSAGLFGGVAKNGSVYEGYALLTFENPSANQIRISNTDTRVISDFNATWRWFAIKT